MRHTCVAWLAAGLLSIAACTPEGDKARAVSPSEIPPLAAEDRVVPAAAAAADETAPTLTVEVGCSPTKLRTAIATVTWRGEGELEQSERLDIAAAKQGFLRGQFLKVGLDPTPEIEPSAGLRATPADEVLGRTLDLQVEVPVQEVQEGQPANASAFEGKTVRVVDLEPGVVYYFRLARERDGHWIASEPVRVDAPACVADIIGEER